MFLNSNNIQNQIMQELMQRKGMMDTGNGMFQPGGVSMPIPMNTEMPVNKTGMFDTGGGMFMNAGVSAPIPTPTNADLEFLIQNNPLGLDYDQNSGMFFDPQGTPMDAETYKYILKDIQTQQNAVDPNKKTTPMGTIMEGIGGLFDYFNR